MRMRTWPDFGGVFRFVTGHRDIGRRDETMARRFPRLLNILLVLITVLLLLNILLPTRSTVQLVQVREGLETEMTASLQPPSKPSVRPREETESKESTQLVTDTELVTASTESDAEVRPERARAPPWSRRDIFDEEFQRRRREEDLWPGQPEAGVDYREPIREREDLERINLHNPAQRLAYYKKLRRRMMEGGPDIRAMRERRANRRLEMVREMWDGWFEDSQESLHLGQLTEYVTNDISPEVLQSELAHCATTLGVSAERLDTQKEDLLKSSKKLSAFLAAIKSLIPKSFSPNFTSPCWYSDQINARSNLIGITARILGLEGHLQILPNQASYLARQAFGDSLPLKLFCMPHFFLAGFPKSATTTLSDVLFGHPQVSSALVKESHWWTRAPILSPSENLLRLNVLRYLMHFRHMADFAEKRPGLLSMDGSQSTLWDSNFVFNGHDFCSTPAAIAHVIPRAKFVILMREPSERLYSYYLWSCSYRYGNNTSDWPPSVRRDPAGNFHTEVSQFITEFNHCLESKSLYECANKYTFENATKATQFCGQIGFRLVVSLYYIHIFKFLQFFPREQFLFLKMEDMMTKPVAFLHSVTDFLDIRSYPVRDVRDALERKHNKQKAGIGPMHKDTKQLLHDFFAPYNRQLARLIDDEGFLWEYS